jgi:hypothetical protein
MSRAMLQQQNYTFCINSLYLTLALYIEAAKLFFEISQTQEDHTTAQEAESDQKLYFERRCGSLFVFWFVFFACLFVGLL